MAMSPVVHGRHRPEINVTPMIDVLLVLIIIFMVIAPVTSRGLNTLVPQPARDDRSPTPPSQDIVVTVNGDRTVDLNQEPVGLEDLHGRLQTVFRNHPSHVLFVRGRKDLEFQAVAEVIDIVRGAGLDRIALMTQ